MEPHRGHSRPLNRLLHVRQTYFTVAVGEPVPKNPPPKPPEPPIRPIIFLRSIRGNAIKIAKAMPSPYGKGKTICNPMLIANEANRKIKYIL